MLDIALVACLTLACIYALQQKQNAARLKGQLEDAQREAQQLTQKQAELETALRQYKKEEQRLTKKKRSLHAGKPAPAPHEFSKLIDQPNPRRVQQEETPPPAPKLVTFGFWPPEAHHINGQQRRYKSAKSQTFSLVSMENHCAVVRGTSGNLYHVTLNSCTCPDFEGKLQKQRPCKHIYYLALQLGLPLSDIFGE